MKHGNRLICAPKFNCFFTLEVELCVRNNISFFIDTKLNYFKHNRRKLIVMLVAMKFHRSYLKLEIIATLLIQIIRVIKENKHWIT